LPTTLLALLNREAGESRRDILLAILISSAANTAILIVINKAAASIADGGLNLRLLGLFLVALGLYITGLRYTFDATTRIFEHMLTRIRVNLTERIAGSELLLLHAVGKPRIFQAITVDIAIISESQGLLVAAAHSVVMIACTGVYVLLVSMPAFFTIVAVIGVGILLYLSRAEELNRLIGASVGEEIRVISLMSDVIDGLKEVKLSHARRTAMVEELGTITDRLRDIKMRTAGVYNRNAVFSQSFFYVLLAVIVFVLPHMVGGFASTAPELVATVLFIFGPISTVVTAIPAAAKANRAAASLLAIEAEIDHVTTTPGTGRPPKRLPFKQLIECRGVEFHYPGTDAGQFSVGPIDLTLRHGEITMFVGGNGSGKTTLLKVIAGLYPPDKGVLAVDGKPVPLNRLPNLREMYGAIFSDFHLFAKLYGVAADDEAIAAQLDHMGIADKVGYAEDGFTTRDLSTGQRKRVAMIVALLEDRPVLILDEWAAEQDPEFRQYFYEELLPALKRQGKTLLVASHDDRYFGLADMVVKMELGRIQSVTRREDKP
jgi:putative ATP-binding cassette transporter